MEYGCAATASPSHAWDRRLRGQAGGDVPVDEEGDDVAVSGGDLGPDHDLRPLATEGLLDLQGTTAAVLVRDGRDRQVAAHQLGSHP
jgi:hypothetical protein